MDTDHDRDVTMSSVVEEAAAASVAQAQGVLAELYGLSLDQGLTVLAEGHKELESRPSKPSTGC